MESFDLKSIKGAELQTLATEIAKVILSDGSVIAQALASLDKRVSAVENIASEIGNAGIGEMGLVTLITSTTSESENCAATPKSIKAAYDSLNSAKQNKLSAAQQSAVDSGITTSKRTSYDNHIADNDIHVTTTQKESWNGKQDKLTNTDAQIKAAVQKAHEHSNKSVLDGITAEEVVGWDDAYSKRHEHSNKDELDKIASGDVAKWDGKQDKLTSAQQSAVDSGVTKSKRTSYDNHIADNDIHVTKNQKNAWDDKAETNGYYPDMSVGGSDHSEVSAAVKDYNDSSSIIKIGYAGASLSSCTTLAAYTTFNGVPAIKDIPAEEVSVGKARVADSSYTSTKSNYASAYAEFGDVDSGVAITDALPRFFSKEFGLIYLSALQENKVANLFNLTGKQAGFLFWTVQLEDVPVDMVITFTVIKSKKAWGDGEEISSAALYVKSGNSTVSFITQYSYNVDDSGNLWYYLTALPRHSYSGSISCRATCFRLTGAVQRFGGPW